MKKYIARKWPAFHKRITQIVVPKNFLLAIGFLLLLVMKLATLKAQEQQLQYNIVRNGNVVGWTKLVRSINDQQVDIKLQTEVQTRFVFQFVVKALEEAVFNNGNLVYTSQYRKLNSDVKENKTMRLTNRGYELYKGKDTQPLTLTGLRHHMLGLYFEEPYHGEKIYSDSFQQLLAVEKLADGAYKINLPDGNSCSYYYKNGICTNVKIDHRFYSAEMMLTPTIN
jgi:hypothetical protein